MIYLLDYYHFISRKWNTYTYWQKLGSLPIKRSYWKENMVPPDILGLGDFFFHLKQEYRLMFVELHHRYKTSPKANSVFRLIFLSWESLCFLYYSQNTMVDVISALQEKLYIVTRKHSHKLNHIVFTIKKICMLGVLRPNSKTQLFVWLVSWSFSMIWFCSQGWSKASLQFT